MPAVKGLDILDIRGDMPEMDLKEQVVSMLKQNPRMLPTMLVYNDKGLQLFEEVCFSAVLTAQSFSGGLHLL